VLVAGVVAAGAWVFFYRQAEPAPTLRARLRGPSRFPQPLAFSPDGSTLAVNDSNYQVSLWDVATARPRNDAEPVIGGLGARFSPDGTLLALADARVKASQLVQVYEPRTNRLVRQIELGQTLISDYRFSPDGAALQVVLSDVLRAPLPPNSQPQTATWQVRAWETATWAERPARSVTMPSQQNWPTLSPDGPLVASSSGRTSGVTLWDTATGTALATLANPASPGTVGVWSREFAPDGATLAVGKSDGTVELWDVASRRLLRTLPGHPGRFVRGLLFAARSPETLVTLASDADMSVPAQLSRWFTRFFKQGPAKWTNEGVAVWDLKTGRRRLLLPGGNCVAISPDGSTLAVPSGDGAVNLWDLSPKAPGSAPAP
jgi:WD40 repeat protein